ncbi:MAG: type I-E CRISPR-associated endoribonuclease Cas2e [Candidatus Helarchaeota archaeon]
MIIIPKLVVIVTESAPYSLRGELTRWLVEIRPGIFVGSLSALVIDTLWSKISKNIKSGGAFLITPTNNEQHFKIQYTGNTKRSIIEFDGLQLIKFPLPEPCEPSKPTSTILPHQHTTQTPPSLHHSNISNMNLPPNFIVRTLHSHFDNNSYSFSYSGISSFPYIQYPNIWLKQYFTDIELFANSLLNLFTYIPPSKLESSNLLNSSITSIDIETTNSIQLAFQGQVCIVCIASLNFHSPTSTHPTLYISQILDLSPPPFRPNLLLQILRHYLVNPNSLIVFNKDFDIKILRSIISKFNLKFPIPSSVIDLHDHFFNLIELENYLYSKLFIKRYSTNKKNYSDYYKSFIGKQDRPETKKIEPIGTYNIIDTLSPLIAYILLNFAEKR